jgi:hypothetical protein
MVEHPGVRGVCTGDVRRDHRPGGGHGGRVAGALSGLPPLWRRETLISDSGGAFTSNAFEAVCKRLHIAHEPIESTKGDSSKNLLETHFTIQWRLYDYQFSLTRTPTALDEVHQRFVHTYNTTAHQGLVHEGFEPPIPRAVLGGATGRRYSPEALVQKFSRAVCRRTTNRYGCVTLQHYHFAVAEGLPQTPVLLWVYGEQ